MDFIGKQQGLWRLICIFTLILFSFSLGVISPSAQSGTLPENFSSSILVDGLSSPTAMAFAPDGRLFVAQQGGALRVIKDGALLSTPFLTVNVHNTGERGLLGVTFDPNFNSNGYVYIYYTVNTDPKHNRVSRFTADGDVALGSSELVLMDLPDLSGATNHNGGALHFGPDGKLYIAVGENANGSLAQSLDTVLGSILRINADGSIPTDNPFYNVTTGINRSIWAIGLRNPFTFAFQPGTGTMYINDVGQMTWEEINVGQAGANYGWPTTEGETSNPDFVSPLYVYPHSAPQDTDRGCAIAGAAFYNPATMQFPADYAGDFFFADYCNRWIKRYDAATDTAILFASDIQNGIVDIRIHPDGSLYYLARGSNAVHVVRYSSEDPPVITQQPADVTANAGSTAQFQCGATGAPPLTYQWKRDNTTINGATSGTLTLANVSLSDNGAKFQCTISNAFGSANSREALLTVMVNEAPTVTITTPLAGTKFTAGQTIAYSGSASDPEDGTVPASNLTWQVDLHHDEHTHPFIAPFSGQSEGTFVIPNEGHTEANIWYRLHLTAADSQGSESSTFVDILPNQITLTVATSPNGLRVDLDGQPQQTPASSTAVAGVQRQLSAPLQQTVNDTLYALWGWSDGGAATHIIYTPSVDTTYTAIYAEINILQAGFTSIPAPNATIDLGSGVINTERLIYLQVLSNNSTDLTLESAIISGADADVFSVSGIPITLAAGSATVAQLPVTCTPAEIKTYTAVLTLTTTDTNHATVHYTLTCEGIAAQENPPNAPQNLTINPNQGRPAVTWRNDPQALWYNIWIGNIAGTLHYDWYPVNPADEFREGVDLPPLECAGLTCTLKPNINPFSGSYIVWMRSWGHGGYSMGGVTDYDGWATAEFTLPDTPPGSISGITATTASNGKVTLGWQGASQATWYNVWLGTAPDEWDVRFFDWVLAEDVGCENGGSCTLAPGAPIFFGESFDTTLTTDEYIVYVRAWGPGGFGAGGVENSGWYAGEVFAFP